MVGRGGGHIDQTVADAAELGNLGVGGSGGGRVSTRLLMILQGVVAGAAFLSIRSGQNRSYHLCGRELF